MINSIAPASSPTRRIITGALAGAACGALVGSGTAYAGEVAADAPSPPELLIDRALAHGDEHVIKFTEACLCRDALASSPAYPAAVANVLGMIGRR